ncbi:MAG: hypothetical protein AB1481_06205 [Candidatus Omnitrophota bacterium]
MKRYTVLLLMVLLSIVFLPLAGFSEETPEIPQAEEETAEPEAVMEAPAETVSEETPLEAEEVSESTEAEPS